MPNNVIDSDSKKRRDEGATPFAAGYGFPMHRGGPMFYADTVGLPHVVAAMEKYAGGRHGKFWKPAPLLVKLAAEGKTFN